MRPYLGDVIGDHPSPMRPVYLRRIDARCWVKRSLHLFLACAGIGAAFLLLLVYLVMLFAYFPATPLGG